MVYQWEFFGSISAIRKIWSLTANSRSLQAAALKAPRLGQTANVRFAFMSKKITLVQDNCGL